MIFSSYVQHLHGRHLCFQGNPELFTTLH